MKVGSLEITGASASGVSTCLVVQPHKIVLDIGYCSSAARDCQTVLVTHSHIDHMAGAVQHAASRSLAGQAPSRFVCGPQTAADLERVLSVWKDVQGGFNYTIESLESGKELSLGNGLCVTSFPTYHRIPSTGFLVSEVRKKLKPEFVGLSGKEIGVIHQSGKEVTDTVKAPLFAYTGDTTPDVLEVPELWTVPVLIMECTFLGSDVSVVKAREHGHTHIEELAAKFWTFTGELVLGHFSLRYSQAEIEAALAGLKAIFGPRLHLLLDNEGPVSAW